MAQNSTYDALSSRIHIHNSRFTIISRIRDSRFKIQDCAGFQLGNSHEHLWKKRRQQHAFLQLSILDFAQTNTSNNCASRFTLHASHYTTPLHILDLALVTLVHTPHTFRTWHRRPCVPRHPQVRLSPNMRRTHRRFEASSIPTCTSSQCNKRCFVTTHTLVSHTSSPTALQPR